MYITEIHPVQCQVFLQKESPSLYHELKLRDTGLMHCNTVWKQQPVLNQKAIRIVI
jgi:hypothetical protein